MLSDCQNLNISGFYKTRHILLSDGANCTVLRAVVLTQYRRVTAEILPPSDLPSPVNGILWEMSELITQERIAVGSSNLVEGLNT